MIKRVVILQDETLVIREMERNPRAAGMLAAVGAGQSRLPAAGASDEADDLEPIEAEEAPVPEPAEVAAVAPGGSRLADVAKSAAMKAERTIIEDTLQQVHWNRRRAAEQLGVSYKTLLNKIKECGISRQ
jgi:DNA-binding NtrC family response regulator